MIDWLRQTIINFIENFESESEWNWTSDIKWCITSSYYSDVIRAFREMWDVALWTKEDWTYYFLPFRVDVVWDIDDWDRYTEAFCQIKIWDKEFTVRVDPCVLDEFNNTDEFVNEIMRLTEETEKIKSFFNLLRPIYNERV